MNKFEKQIKRYRDTINSDLKKVYSSGPESLKHPINHVLNGKGKRLRPILTLIICDMNFVPEHKSLPAALAMEILHNFTLIHDDIMDKDLVRHGIETVHSKWDENTAILAGDAMLAVSMRLLTNTSYSNSSLILNTYVKGLLAVCEGQAYDIEFENKNYVNLKEYKNMIYLKTAYMIGLASQIGAMVSNLTNEECEKLRIFGESLGMAYQVQDDILELFSEKVTMNKSLESDILLKKKTFLWASMEDEDDINRLDYIMTKFPEDKVIFLKELRKFVEDRGVRDKANSFIIKNINRANDILLSLNGDTDMLQYFSDLIIRREK